MWRVWIEIQMLSMVSLPTVKSPSVWRVWIEIVRIADTTRTQRSSPSVWRVWIEIVLQVMKKNMQTVTLRVEGVD